MFDLVSATVPGGAAWCTTEVIDIESTAVSHLNVGGPVTTGIISDAKADRPGYLAVRDCGMSTT